MHTATPRLAALLVLLAPATLAAAEPADPYARGKQMLDTYFRKFSTGEQR